MTIGGTLLHGGSLPHTDTFGLPGWLQWAIAVPVIAGGLWLIVDARRERRRAAASPERIEPAPAAAGTGRASEPLVRQRPVLAVDHRPRAGNAVARRVGRVVRDSIRLVVVLGGIVAGWIALDHVRAADVVASFLRTDGATNVVRLGFAYAALLWVGAALAIDAPRRAAGAFATAAAIAAMLATVDRWQTRLGWWGAESTLAAWSNLWLWAGIAGGLALLALLSHRRRSRHKPASADTHPGGYGLTV